MDTGANETVTSGALSGTIAEHATAAGMIAGWDLPGSAPRAHAMREALVSYAASSDDDPSLLAFTALGPLLILTAHLEAELAAARDEIAQLRSRPEN